MTARKSQITNSQRRWAHSGFTAVFVALGLVVSGGQVGAQGPSGKPDYGVRAALTGKTTLEKNHFSYALVPGGTVGDAIIVSNFTSAAITFRIHGADLITTQGGGVAPAPEDAPLHLAGAWIHVKTPELKVPAHQELTDPFTVTIPPGQPPGDYLGAVVAAPQPVGGPGIHVLTREALIARVTVPGN
ncbi:MAG: hypothetical protein ABR564_04965, partial [Candidatus Dormibacteria bacterium]